MTAFARGQEFRATLTGRVTDPVAAPVAGAVVALLNVDTNERLRHKTDGQGNYSFALIRPGNYELRVEHTGFKTMVRHGIIPQVNQAATVDLSLTLGTVTETVTVTDEAPLLDTASADRGGTIGQQFIKEMPLNNHRLKAVGAVGLRRDCKSPGAAKAAGKPHHNSRLNSSREPSNQSRPMERSRASRCQLLAQQHCG